MHLKISYTRYAFRATRCKIQSRCSQLSPGLDIEAEVAKRIQAQVFSGTRRASSAYPAPPKTKIRRGQPKFVEGIFPKIVPSTDGDIKVEYESSDDEFGAGELPK